MKKLQLFKTMLLLLVLVVGTGSAWGLTASLTNANIVAAGSGGTGYTTYNITDGNDKTWKAYAIKNQHSNATSSYHFLQIKAYASSTSYYIQVPAYGTKITNISMTVSSTQQPMTGGGNSATLFFSSSKSTSSAGTGVASGTGDKSVSIDCSSLNLNTGYITASGAVRIWNVTLTYEENSTEYTITIDNDIENGSVSADKSKATAGTEITLTPNPDSGYGLSAWNVVDGSSNAVTVTNNKFTMPASNVTVGATFSLLRAITVNDAEHGSMAASPTSAVVGQTITLTATPDANYELSGVTVTNTSTSAAVATSGTGNERTFTMPDAPVSVTPTFTMQKGIEANPYTVAEVTSYITGGGTGNKYTRGIISQVGATFTSGGNTYLTYYISDDGTTTNQLMVYRGKNLGNTNYAAATDLKVGDRVVVYGPVTYYSNTTPEYTTGNYIYSISRDFTFYLDDISNGSVAIQVNGVNQVPNVDGEVTVASGATVTLTATPASGYTFANWTCDNATYNNSTTNPLEFEMPFDDILFGASFLDANAKYDIVVDDAIVGGTISADVDQAKAGETVTLTASPAANYVFDAWDVQDDNSVAVDVTNNQFTMPASDVTVTATFKKVHTITYYINGVENTTTRVDGQELNLDAPAATAFAGWSSANSAASPVFVANDIVVNSDLTLYAIFVASRSISNQYVKVTSVGDVTAGQYLIVSEANTVAFNASNATLDATGNNITVSISSSKISVSDATEAAEVTITPITDGYSIKTPTKYIGRSATSNGMDTSDEPLVNTITFSSNNAVIKGSGGVQLQLWKSGANMCFKYYASNQSVVQLYKRPITTTYSLSEYEAVNISAAGWATYATKSDVEFTDGDAYVVVSADDDENTTTIKSVTEVPAGTPVLMKGTSGSAVVKYAEVLSSTPAAPASNYLHIVGAGETINEASGVYVLANKANGVGFYPWTGTALAEGKIYLQLPAGAKMSDFFAITEAEETDGINSVSTRSNKQGEFYNLAGQRVNRPTRGLYIVNGKKVIVK